MTTPNGPRRAKPVARNREEAVQPARGAPATQLAVPIGPRVLEVLALAYRARRPILLEGPTGVGKSQIVSAFARATGIDIVVLDLSLLEPPDLVGLPVIRDGRTHYASPAELPSSGRGVLLLEELNRAEIPVMQPALQLLSARRLHAYELPEGWICAAAINPEDGDYQVNRLDPALRSRFLQLSVCADRAAWLEWAEHANVHPVVMRVVRDHADPFEHASPRSWSYASDVLHALRPDEIENRDLVRVALRGYLPTPWAMLVTDAVVAQAASPTIDPAALFASDGKARLAGLVRGLESKGRVDAIAMLASRIRRILGSDELTRRVGDGSTTLESLEALLEPLPGDLREQCLESAVESNAATALLRAMGHDPARIVVSYAGSSLSHSVKAWRREMRLYRVRLVVVAVARFLDGGRERRPEAVDDALDALTPHLAALVADAGPLAADLASWLETRGASP